MKLSIGLLFVAIDVSNAFTPHSLYYPHHKKEPSVVSTHTTSIVVRATETESDTTDDWYADFDPSEFEQANSNTNSNTNQGGGGYSSSGSGGGGGGYSSGGGGGYSSGGGGGNVGHDYTRDTYADSSNVDLDKVNYLLAERLELRKTRRFDEADAMRDELLDKHGVLVKDRELTWRSGCSAGGSGSRWGNDRGGGRGGGGRGGNDRFGGDRGGRGGGRRPKDFGPNGHDYNLAADAGPNESTLTDQEIHQMLAERLECKLNRDYHTADEIQEDLRAAGVAINDKQKMWRADGAPFEAPKFASRVYRQSQYSEATEEAEQIQAMVQDRSKAKAERSYGEADEIRDALYAEFGVTIDDRRAEWTVGGDFGTTSIPDGNNRQLNPFEKQRGCPPSDQDAQIQQLLDDRDAARKDRDYETADTIRDDLKGMGVFIDDRKRIWSFGRDAGAGSDSGEYHRRGGGSLSDEDVEEIISQLAKRFECKRNRHFKSADEIRDSLQERFKVQIDDRNKEWHVVTDNYMMAAGSTPVDEETAETISELVEKRAVAKLQKDYPTADSIRDMLMETYNVVVDDRVKEWQLLDITKSGDSIEDIRAVVVEDETESESEDEIPEDTTAAVAVDLEDLEEDLKEIIATELEVEEEEEEEEEETQEEEMETVSESMEELEKLTIPVLKEKLRELELPVGGKKAELIARIMGEE